jgi:hypothetical protein
MKTAVIRNVMPCSLVDSAEAVEQRTASIFKSQNVNPGSSDNYYMEVLLLQFLYKF